MKMEWNIEKWNIRLLFLSLLDSVDFFLLMSSLSIFKHVSWFSSYFPTNNKKHFYQFFLCYSMFSSLSWIKYLLSNIPNKIITSINNVCNDTNSMVWFETFNGWKCHWIAAELYQLYTLSVIHRINFSTLQAIEIIFIFSNWATTQIIRYF